MKSIAVKIRYLRDLGDKNVPIYKTNIDQFGIFQHLSRPIHLINLFTKYNKFISRI